MSRRISDGAAEEGYPDRDRGELKDADPDRRRNEQQGRVIGANDRHLVGPRDEKVGRESVGERSRHDHGEKGGGERGIESENRERRHGGGGRVPSLVASAVTYSDRETGRSSTTCHTPDFGHSEAATKALAASSAWIQDQTAAPPSTRTGRPRTSDSPKTRVCHPS